MVAQLALLPVRYTSIFDIPPALLARPLVRSQRDWAKPAARQNCGFWWRALSVVSCLLALIQQYYGFRQSVTPCSRSCLRICSLNAFSDVPQIVYLWAFILQRMSTTDWDFSRTLSLYSSQHYSQRGPCTRIRVNYHILLLLPNITLCQFE